MSRWKILLLLSASESLRSLRSFDRLASDWQDKTFLHTSEREKYSLGYSSTRKNAFEIKGNKVQSRNFNAKSTEITLNKQKWVIFYKDFFSFFLFAFVYRSYVSLSLICMVRENRRACHTRVGGYTLHTDAKWLKNVHKLDVSKIRFTRQFSSVKREFLLKLKINKFLSESNEEKYRICISVHGSHHTTRGDGITHSKFSLVENWMVD